MKRRLARRTVLRTRAMASEAVSRANNAAQVALTRVELSYLRAYAKAQAKFNRELQEAIEAVVARAVKDGGLTKVPVQLATDPQTAIAVGINRFHVLAVWELLAEALPGLATPAPAPTFCKGN